MGGGLFVIALFAAMLEQHLSGLAFRGQVRLVQKYYLKESSQTEDVVAIKRLRITRYAAYGLFASAVLSTAVGLISIKDKSDGATSVSTVSTTNPTAGATDFPAATGNKRSGSQVRPELNTAPAATAR
jgi:hypothetical protein